MQGEQNIPRRNTNNTTPLQKQEEQTKEKENYKKLIKLSQSNQLRAKTDTINQRKRDCYRPPKQH